MNSRERVMAAASHQEPDRVPVDMVLTIDVYRDMKRLLKMDHLPDTPRMGHWTDVQTVSYTHLPICCPVC